MADVIRNVVVRVKLEQVQADLKAPDMGPVKREIASAQQSVEGLNKTVKDTSQDIQQAAQQQTETFQQFRDETNRSAEALSKLASAGGLYAVAMDDALPPSIRLFSAIRGGIEQVSGLTTIFASLGGVLTGPVGAGIAIVTTALTLGAVAWKNYRDAAKDARATAGADTPTDLLGGFGVVTPSLLQERANALRIEALTTPVRRGDVEGGTAAIAKLTEAKNLELERLQLTKERNAEFENVVIQRQQELDLAKNALDVSLQQLEAEKQKQQSIEASLGALSRGEQNRLRNLANRFGAGEELTRGQLQQLQQLGGGLTAGVVQAEFADRGRGLADEIARSLGIDRNADLRTAQQQANTVQQRLEELLNGQDFESVIETLKARRQELRKQTDETITEITQSLNRITEAFVSIRDVIGLQNNGRL